MTDTLLTGLTFDPTLAERDWLLERADVDLDRDAHAETVELMLEPVPRHHDDPPEDDGMGVRFWTGRTIAAREPWKPMMVSRGGRPRVRRHTSSTDRPRFRNSTQRKAWRENRVTNVQAAAEQRLAATIAAYARNLP